MEYRTLNSKGTTLDKPQLEAYLEKLAADQILKQNTDKQTYPIPKLKENFEVIEEVYHLLNEHLKLGITIHPAGEWILDNFYIIEETVKTIIKEMDIKKYQKFIGIDNGKDKGFARVYVLATEMIAYTDNKVNRRDIEDCIASYQRKKTLSMQEIWNIGLFMQIAIIQNIKDICEKIYFSQMQKYRVENILERLVEKKEDLKYKNLSQYKARVKGYGEMKYPFIEYMSYRLKAYGKSGAAYMVALEEQVNKMGTTIEEVIKKEHFDIAIKKVSMGNSILSMKELLRIDFLEIFEKLNGVEDILKQDPLNVYEKMDYKTKEEYRNTIAQIAKKSKISEMYVAKKALKLAQEVHEREENEYLELEAKKEVNLQERENKKEEHIGYYLIGKGKEELFRELQIKRKKPLKENTKEKLYVFSIWSNSVIISLILCYFLQQSIHNLVGSIVAFFLIILPIQEIVVQIQQSILGKMVKPKLIPKMDFQKGIPKKYATFVVIPTILKSKEKVKELMKKLEVYAIANPSENLYFALLGDCSSGPNKEEPFDKEVIQEGMEQTKRLNQKYGKEEGIPKFSFLYRTRYWNGKEECYLGWERKRGLLNQFNEYVLGNVQNAFRVNTLEEQKQNLKRYKIYHHIRCRHRAYIKYRITASRSNGTYIK